LAAWRGDFDNAFDLAEEGMRTSRRNALPEIASWAALATALLEQERPSEVVGLLSDLPRVAEETSEKWDLTHPFLAGGEAHLMLGSVPKAAEYGDAARRYLQGNAYWAPSVDRLTAQIDLAKGDAPAALQALEPWLEEPGPMKFEHARLLEVAARALVFAGRRSEGLERAEEASRLYQELGAEPRAGRLNEWLASFTARKPGRPRSTAVGELTEREREVLSLLTDGLTNREIAQELTISHATVKKHVENVKVKVGASRRTELVRLAEGILGRPDLGSGGRTPELGRRPRDRLLPDSIHRTD
jgi:DNA-binding CsgD family transcriptional regulator